MLRNIENIIRHCGIQLPILNDNDSDTRFWTKYHFAYPIVSAVELKRLNDRLGKNMDFFEDVVSMQEIKS